MIEELSIRADAREWFADRISLVVWCWDDEVAGGCDPSLIVGRLEAKRPFPAAVRREAPGFLTELLMAEWARAKQSTAPLPTITPFQDRAGRMVLEIGLEGIPVEQRILVGRALIRPPVLGTWDPVNHEIAYLRSAKICYLNRDGHDFLDPSTAMIADTFEEIDPETDSGSNFLLLFRDATVFHAWIERVGLIVEIVVNGSAASYRAAYPGPGVPTREIRFMGMCADEEFLSFGTAQDILLRFLARPSKLPQIPKLIWRQMAPDFSRFNEEDFP